jgi:hypothetical protein
MSQPGYATVLTKQGIRTIQDISIGQPIWCGLDWYPVVRIDTLGTQPVFEYRTREGICVCTEDHSISESGKSTSVKHASLIDTVVGPYLSASTKDTQCVIDGMTIEYGGVHPDYGTFIFAPDRLKQKLCTIAPSFMLSKIPTSISSFMVKSTLTKEDLVAYPDRKLPQRLMQMPANNICSLLSGIFSASGSITCGVVNCRVASLHIAKQIQTLLSSVGILSYLEQPSNHWYTIALYESSHLFMERIGFIFNVANDTLSLRSPCANQSKVVNSIYVGDYPTFTLSVQSPREAYWTGGTLSIC